MAIDMNALQEQLNLQQAELEREAEETSKPQDRGDAAPEAEKAAAPEPEKAPEAKIEPPKEAEPERDPKTGQFIPKARFDELNHKKKAEIAALNARLAAMEKQLQAKSGEDIGALEDLLGDKTEAYNKQMADGDLAAAKTTMKEMNQLNRRIAFLEITPVAAQQVAATAVASTLDQLVDFYKAEFPEFDDSREGTFNQDYVNWIAELQGKFETAGYSSPEALQEAVELAVLKFQLKPSSGRTAEAPKPDAGGARKQSAVAAAVKTASKQPPLLDSPGIDSDKMGTAAIDTEHLTIADLGKLPEATIKRLRGDLM